MSKRTGFSWEGRQSRQVEMAPSCQAPCHKPHQEPDEQETGCKRPRGRPRASLPDNPMSVMGTASRRAAAGRRPIGRSPSRWR